MNEPTSPLDASPNPSSVWAFAEREAKDPSTPSHHLVSLAAIPRLAPIVAANPNTPLETLIALADLYPDHVLSNQSYRLSLATNPHAALNGMSPSTLRAFLRRPDLPSLVKQHAEQSLKQPLKPLKARAKRPNPSVGDGSASWEEVMVEYLHPDQKIFRNPHLVSDALAEAFAGAYGESQASMQAFAKNHGIASSVARKLLDSHDALTRGIVAENPRLPVRVLQDRIHEPEAEDRNDPAFLAQRQDADPEALEYVYEQWGATSTAPRLWLAENPSTPSHILEKLYSAARQEGHRVLESSLASNPNLPDDLASRLVRSRHETTLEHLAKHADDLPTTVQDILLKHATPNVREPARRTTNQIYVLETLAQGRPRDRLDAAHNPHTPPDTLARLTRDEHERVATTALKNPSLPTSVMEGITSSFSLRLADTTHNPSMPHDLAERCLRIAQEYVSSGRGDARTETPAQQAVQVLLGLARNKHLPIHLRLDAALTHDQVLKDTASELALETPPTQAGLAFAVRLPDESTLTALLAAQVPTQALEGWEGNSLARHPSWLVRYTLATRHDLPASLKAILEQDSDTRVRAKTQQGGDPPAPPKHPVPTNDLLF